MTALDDALDRMEIALRPDWLAREYLSGPVQAVINPLLDEIGALREQVAGIEAREQALRDAHKALDEKNALAWRNFRLFEKGRDLVSHAVAWEGPESWKEDTLALLDEIIRQLQPPPLPDPDS